MLLEVAEQPDAWDVQLKKFSAVVSGVFVAAGQEQTLSLSAKPKRPTQAGPSCLGHPPVAVNARTADGVLSQSLRLR